MAAPVNAFNLSTRNRFDGYWEAKVTGSGGTAGGAARGVTIIGVGGAGGNAVATLLRDPGHGLRVLCANTDRQALGAVAAPHRLQLGRRLTDGLGAGAD